MTIIISKIIPYGSQEYQAALSLRQAILRAPLGLDLMDEDLSGERENFHLGLFEGSRLLATLMLIPTYDDQFTLRQVAVDRHFQGRGLGRKLMVFAEKFAANRGCKAIVLNARASAKPFYEKQGYITISKPFTELGIPHIRMKKTL